MRRNRCRLCGQIISEIDFYFQSEAGRICSRCMLAMAPKAVGPEPDRSLLSADRPADAPQAEPTLLRLS